MNAALEHPMRRLLNDELHARQFNEFHGTGRFIRYVYFTQSHDKGLMKQINKLLKSYDLPAMAAAEKFVRYETDKFAIRVERHTEFISISLIDKDDVPCAFGRSEAYDEAAYPHLPFAEIAAFKHPVFHAMWLEISTMPETMPRAAVMQKALAGRAVSASKISSGGAHLYYSFDIDEAGYSRIALLNDTIAGHRMGRVIQRVIELETYRLLAMLNLPKVKEFSPRLDSIETELRSATEQLSAVHDAKSDNQSVDDADKLLARLTSLSADLEQIYSQTSYRFAASKAYYEIVNARLFELSTSRLNGFQSIRGFLDRRMSPAMQSATAFARRMDRLSSRNAYAGQLQRSQTELVLQKQNHDLLASMNKRTSAQLRLQQTVESLSIAAVTYYGVGLIGYLAASLPLADYGVDKKIVQAIFVQIIAYVVWRQVKLVRKVLGH